MIRFLIIKIIIKSKTVKFSRDANLETKEPCKKFIGLIKTLNTAIIIDFKNKGMVFPNLGNE